MKGSYNQIRKREVFRAEQAHAKSIKERADQAAETANNQIRINVRHAIQQFTKRT